MSAPTGWLAPKVVAHPQDRQHYFTAGRSSCGIWIWAPGAWTARPQKALPLCRDCQDRIRRSTK